MAIPSESTITSPSWTPRWAGLRARPDHQDAAVAGEFVITHDREQRNVLAGDADVSAADAAEAEERPATKVAVLPGIAKQSPWAMGMMAVLTPMTAAAAVHQRAAAVTGVQGRIGLDDVVDKPV